MKKYEDLTGLKYGRMTCLSYAGKTKAREALWECVCECGNHKVVRAAELKRGRIVSCGCVRNEVLATHRPKNYHEINVKHGETHSRLYNIWANMKQRCYNPNVDCYKWYGGKGVQICQEWLNNYEAFRDWALSSGYRDDLTIDRLKSDKDYSPDNCRWIPHEENARRAHLGIKHLT